MHRKAGVITSGNGRKVAFMGRMNETYGGWGKGGNYEIAWVDDEEDISMYQDSVLKDLTKEKTECLQRFVRLLKGWK